MSPTAGDPDVIVAGLRLWVHGRQFPESQDHWDGNWLDVTARYEGDGATVEASGSFLLGMELARFGAECRRLYDSLSGEAALHPLEPNLSIQMTASSRGHIDVVVQITPDHMTQHHEFRETIDQSYLPAILEGIDRVMQRIPIRGDADRIHGRRSAGARSQPAPPVRRRWWPFW